MKKKYAAFLVLLGSTCVQKLKQFEYLTLAIKISFLFDFCTDVLLTVVIRQDDRVTPFLLPGINITFLEYVNFSCV